MNRSCPHDQLPLRCPQNWPDLSTISKISRIALIDDERGANVNRHSRESTLTSRNHREHLFILDLARRATKKQAPVLQKV